MSIVIGLVAEKESGKTTSFNHIKSKIPEAQEVMLAEHLKNVCSQVFPVPKEDFESQQKKQMELSSPIILTEKHVRELFNLFELAPKSTEDVQKHVGKKLSTPRQILQYVGTDVLRAVDSDIHLKWAMKIAPKSDVYVVTDIRFPNEFEFFKGQGKFISVFIDRSQLSKKDSASQHASEQHIQNMKKKCMIEIDNNSNNLADLLGQLDAHVIGYVKYLAPQKVEL